MYLSFSRVKIQFPKDNEEEPIIILQYNYNRNDLIPNTSLFWHCLHYVQMHSWSINPKWIQLLDKNLTSYLKCWIFTRVWSGSGVTDEGHAIFLTFGWFGIWPLTNKINNLSHRFEEHTDWSCLSNIKE